MSQAEIDAYYARFGATTATEAAQLAPTILQDVQQTYGAAHELVSRLENLVTRCLGMAPATGKEGADTRAVKTEGLLNELTVNGEHLRKCIASGHSALGRLEARLG